MSILKNPKNAGRKKLFKDYETKSIKISIPEFNDVLKEAILVDWIKKEVNKILLPFKK